MGRKSNRNVSEDDEIKIVTEINHNTDSKHSNKCGESDDEIKIVHEANSSDKDSCAICLGNFTNRSFLNDCFHAFCYYCILQWSEISQTCPLCKAVFKFIVHDVRSITDYKETHVKKDEQAHIPPEQRAAYRQTVRYRTTAQGSSNNIQQNIGEAVNNRHRRKRRRHKAPRLSEKDKILESRIHVYSNSLYAKEPASTADGKDKKVRKATPDFFANYPGMKHRLIQWLNNELEVLLYNNKDHVVFVLEIIWKLLDKYPIRSEDFQKELKPFLFEKTDQFCHELYMFASSPLDVKTYLSKVQYDGSSSTTLSRWDLSPVQYIGETSSSPGTGDTISRTRWDDTPSPVLVDVDNLVEHKPHIISSDSDASSYASTPKLLTIPTDKQTKADAPILIDSTPPEIHHHPEQCTTPPPSQKRCPSTPVFVSSDENMPLTPTSPWTSPKRNNTPVYRYSSTEDSPVRKPKSKGKGKQKMKKGKQKNKTVLSDNGTEAQPRPVRIVRNENEPCSSKDLN